MAEEQELTENLTGTEKSAILMMLLGEDEAAAVLQNLTPREVQHLGTAMYSVTGVDQNTVNAVLDEFLETIKKQTGLGLGAGKYIENVLTKALGDGFHVTKDNLKSITIPTQITKEREHFASKGQILWDDRSKYEGRKLNSGKINRYYNFVGATEFCDD